MVLHFNSGVLRDKLKEHVNKITRSVRDGFVEKYGTRVIDELFQFEWRKFIKK